MVTNLWVNRMIGDRQPGAPTQYTFTRPVFYKAGSRAASGPGLLGPVRAPQVSAAAAAATNAGRPRAGRSRSLAAAAPLCGGTRYSFH